MTVVLILVGTGGIAWLIGAGFHLIGKSLDNGRKD